MTSWKDTYGRPSQSAPSSRKSSPVTRRSVLVNATGNSCLTPNASPSRPLAASSPRTVCYSSNLSSSLKDRSRARSALPDMALKVGDDEPRIRVHRFMDGTDPSDRIHEFDAKGDLKTVYDRLLQSKDEIIRKMEKKVEHLHRELCFVRQAQEKEIDMLRHTAESTSRMVENEFEKRLNDTVAEAEKQKAALHRDHTRRVQELLESTNKRLQKMEESYGDRISYLARMVDELECKLTTLTKEMEQSGAVRKRLTDERDKLSSELEILQEHNTSYDHRVKELLGDYEKAKDKICQLEMDKGCLIENSRKAMEDMRKHLENEIHMLKEKNVEVELQGNCKSATLEQTIANLKEMLKESEETHNKQMKEKDLQHQQHVQCLEQQHKKEIQEMQREIDSLVRDYSCRLKSLESTGCEKDRQINQMKCHLQKVSQDLEDKVRCEKDLINRYENEIGNKEVKVQSLCTQLANATAEKDKNMEELYRKTENINRQHYEEVHALNNKIQYLQRFAELQAEDSARLLEEEKRRCDEKAMGKMYKVMLSPYLRNVSIGFRGLMFLMYHVSKVSEQLKQSICLYDKEAQELTKQLEDERSLRCQQVNELTEQVQQMKLLLQQQSDEYMCQVEEEKRQFRLQIQDLTKQVEQFKHACEHQSKDYVQQIEDERRLHREQMAQLRSQFELEQQELVTRHLKELDALRKDPQNYVTCLEDKFTKLLTEAEDKAWEQEQGYLKKISELESQLQQLRCEVSQGRGTGPGQYVARCHRSVEGTHASPARSHLCESDSGRARLF